jgi:hypothetical protein
MSLQFYFVLIPFCLFVFLLYLYVNRMASYDKRKNHTRATIALPSHDQIIDSFSLCSITVKDQCFRARIYNIQGKGDAIFLLHGWPQSSISWQPFFDAAKDLDYKIIAFDQRGYSPGARSQDIHDYTTDKLVEDVFSIAGRGTVVTGRVEQGVINAGDTVEMVGIKETTSTTCTGVEMFHKNLTRGEDGDNLGALLRGTKRDEVLRGQVLCAPGSLAPSTEFGAEVYVLTKQEGGRHKPFFTGYRPQFFFRTADITGAVTLEEGTDIVMPGDNTNINIELITPVAMEAGLRFAIREGGNTVGAGVVTSVV